MSGLGSVVHLYTPVSPNVLEMEGIYATGGIHFEHVPLVEFTYLVFTRMPGGVTVGGSGLCCTPCLSSAIIFLYFVIMTRYLRIIHLYVLRIYFVT